MTEPNTRIPCPDGIEGCTVMHYAEPNTLDDCYCVCHSTLSSCAYCEHCKGDNVVSRAVQAPNTDTLDEQMEEILDDAFYEAMQALNSGAKQGYNAWPKVDKIKKTAKDNLKTLFTEHSKQEVELAKLQMSADIFTQFKDAIMRQDLSPRPIHGTRFLTPLEELALILERQAPLSKRNK